MRRLALLSLVALVSLAPPVAAQKFSLSEEERAWIKANPVVRVATDRHWMPIEYLEDGEIKGLAGELLAFIEQNTGLRFVPVPSGDWSSVAGLLERREVDMVSSLVRDFAQPAFAALVSETRTYYIGNTFIFALEDNSMIFDVKQLEGRVVAVKGGGEYEARVRTLYPGITILATRTPEDSLIAVIEGRADAAMGVGQTMLPFLRRKFGGLLQVSGGIASLPVELTMGVRRDLVTLHGIIDKALASVSAERAYEMEERSFDYATYGAPTLRVMFSYYGPILGMLVVSLVLILFFAWHARKERREAIRSESEKKMFIAVLTHEIRTPMNAIIASIELLGRGEELSAESRRLLDLARSGSENLLYLLNDVLDVSKLEAGRLQLDPAPVDVMRLIGSVVDLLAVKAREQGLTLELVQASGIQQWLMLDKVRMEQILQNLISNAIKFTAVGGVKVAVALNTEASSPGMGELQIQVIDTGIGIDSQSLEKLFEPYTQASGSASHRSGGTGLGLLICRQLCELMGGSIGLSSEPGKGTVATVVIPCELHEHSIHEAAQTVPESGAFQVRQVEQALQVLLVEDTPANQIVLQAQLEVLGCHSMLAQTGGDALLALEHNRFDIVLLDCQLPDITGYEVARRWRHAEAVSGAVPTPIVAVSAQNDAAHTIACFDAGMNGVLGKPIRLGKLRDTLALWADMHVAEVFEDALSVGTLQAAADSLQIDVDALEAAIKGHDKEAALYRAHRLLGACAVLGYPRMIVCLKDLQSHLRVQHFEHAGNDMMHLRKVLAEKIAR